MSQNNGTIRLLIALVTRAGVPIVTFPDAHNGQVFAMLVHSLVAISGNPKYKRLEYTVDSKKLLVYVGKKTLIAVLAKIDYIDMVAKFFDRAVGIVEIMDREIVDEGIIDSSVQEKARAKILEVMREAGIRVREMDYLYRKIFGDIYRLVSAVSDARNLGSLFRIAYFPKLVDVSLLSKENNLKLRKLLELCNGDYSLEYISSVVGLKKAEVYRHIAYYIKHRKMILEMGFELANV